MASDQIKEAEEKRDYELSFLVKTEGDVREVARLLEQHKADIRVEGQLSKISLAYKIKHESQAVFGFFRFSALPSDAKSLEKDLESNPGIMRSLVIILPTQRAAVEEIARRKRPAEPRREGIPPEARQYKPLSNEAIEKKIEEILK